MIDAMIAIRLAYAHKLTLPALPPRRPPIADLIRDAILQFAKARP